jgi:hypothetical protein
MNYSSLEKPNDAFHLIRSKTSTYTLNKETNEIIDNLKEIHEFINYNDNKEYKRPFSYKGKIYLKSTINNNIFEFDNDNKIIGNWNINQKKIDFY